MTSGVKWAFCALFDTRSMVKLFHSFGYRKIPIKIFSWRCPLYRSTVFKSWLQLISVSIFELSNKSSSFRLRHSTNEKLFNVYVPHLSNSSDSRNFTTNNRFEWSRILDSKTKIKFHSRIGNTWFTPGIEVWSADRNVWFFFDSHEYKRKRILSEFGVGPRSNPCETRFVGKHQHFTGAEHPSRIKNKIYIYAQTDAKSKCASWTPVAELADTLCQERKDFGSSLGDTWKSPMRFENWLVLRIVLTFKTHVRSFCKIKTKHPCTIPTISLCQLYARTRHCCVTKAKLYPQVHRWWSLLLLL